MELIGSQFKFGGYWDKRKVKFTQRLHDQGGVRVRVIHVVVQTDESLTLGTDAVQGFLCVGIVGTHHQKCNVGSVLGGGSIFGLLFPFLGKDFQHFTLLFERFKCNVKR